ncbi:MAG: zinc metallopeptidase [Eubacteriales bacterium]|nr:zinc metallopeptidase [Eubacteriales bacterium]
MYLFDWTFIILIPGILLALYAQSKVKSAFHKGSQVRSRNGINATQVAQAMLRNHVPYPVSVSRVNGMLSDHYNPQSKSLALSDSVYNHDSLAAIGVAAHEAGHAIQHANHYAPLQLRSALVPVVQISSSLSPIIIMAGFLFSFKGLINIGIIFFALTVLFSLITLPVEFNATKRAKEILIQDGYIAQDELRIVNAVLDAAALTYVAALLNGLLQLLRLILISRRYDD